MLINFTEVVVREMLPTILEKYGSNYPGLCTCEKCKEDIMAIALNRLPPRYVSTSKGSVLTQASYDQIGSKAEVTAAILNAIKIVARSPHHNNNLAGNK